jgi:hypothetical protein
VSIQWAWVLVLVAPVSVCAPRTGAGLTYVPMDSWVYATLERLAVRGLVTLQGLTLRPWTRHECAAQVREARQQLREAEGLEPAERADLDEMVRALEREFAPGPEQGAVVVGEAFYGRNGWLAGPFLNDSYHFGTTWQNDSGRPFGRGHNAVFGFRARAEAGRFFAAVRGEHERAPGREEQPRAVRELMAQLDDWPTLPSTAIPRVNGWKTLEAYAGMRIRNVAISVGRQELYWGPTADAPLSFSTNAAPTANVKVTLREPIRLGGWLRHLGAIRGEVVVGKLLGHQYTERPYFNGQKISLQLTENLEIGATRWAIFLGAGHPVTVENLWRHLVSIRSGSAVGIRYARDPGDRKTGFDFRYRLPVLGRRVQLYSDSYADDDVNPLAAPRRAAISPGLYFESLPGLRRVDLRLEAASTTPMGNDVGPQFVYYNNQYRSGNTNLGRILGSPVGRNGRQLQVRTTYWASARERWEFSYRHLKISNRMLPGGGTQTAGTVRYAWPLGDNWHALLFLQVERFWIPVLGGPRKNFSGWFQLQWEPQMTIQPWRE